MSVVSLQFRDKGLADVFYLVFLDNFGQVKGLVLRLVLGRPCCLFVGGLIAAFVGFVRVRNDLG